MMRPLILSLTVVIGLAAGLMSSQTGCGADAAFDCQSVCSKYQECFDQNFNVGACRDTCRAKAANDASLREKADDCEACIDDKSCADATVSCATQCAFILTL